MKPLELRIVKGQNNVITSNGVFQNVMGVFTNINTEQEAWQSDIPMAEVNKDIDALYSQYLMLLELAKTTNSALLVSGFNHTFLEMYIEQGASTKLIVVTPEYYGMPQYLLDSLVTMQNVCIIEVDGKIEQELSTKDFRATYEAIIQHLSVKICSYIAIVKAVNLDNEMYTYTINVEGFIEALPIILYEIRNGQISFAPTNCEDYIVNSDRPAIKILSQYQPESVRCNPYALHNLLLNLNKGHASTFSPFMDTLTEMRIEANQRRYDMEEIGITFSGTQLLGNISSFK